MSTFRLIGVEGEAFDVELREDAAVADDRVGGERVFAGRLFRAAREGAVHIEREGERVALDDLWVADFHLLRDLAERRAAIAPGERGPLRCRNCGAGLTVGEGPLEPLLVPQQAPEFVRRAPEPWRVELAEPLDGVAAFTIRPVRVKEARALLRFVETEGAIRAAVVRGIGLESLELEGRTLTRARDIADALDQAPDALLDAIAAAYLELAYPLRCAIPTRCGSCEAIHDVPSPAERELDGSWDAIDGDRDHGPFPDFEAFARMARRIARRVYRRNGVKNLQLVVDDGTPAVDDGGEPLLGSYLPEPETVGPTFTEWRFVITLYYRTFEAMFLDAPYDVEAEIDETIDHEIEHHLHHLAGHDPLDEEERAEARRELERTYGKETVRRAEEAALANELAGIGKFFFWGLLVCGLLLAAALALGIVE